MKIIGVSGRDRSGKDTVAEMLLEAGFFGYSFGDATRRYSLERHKDEPDPISVRNMTETSNWLRGERGADVFLKEALEEFEKEQKAGKEYKGVVLYSIRAPIEADFILENGGELVWVEASDEVRHQRRQSAFREGEQKVSIDEMLAQEALQSEPQPGIPEAVQMNLNYVKSKANKVIENNGNDMDAFKQAARKALSI